MSEHLDSLPENPNTIQSPKESYTMNRFFNRKGSSSYQPQSPTPSSAPPQNPSVDPKSWKNSLKLVFYTAVIFLLLSNPIVDGLLSGVSYFSSSISTTIFKVCVFIILFLIVYKKFFSFS